MLLEIDNTSKVVINVKKISNYMQHGVPQYTVPGPILLNLYLNNLSSNFKDQLLNHVDDIIVIYDFHSTRFFRMY